RHEVSLLEADAVLARDRAAHLGTHLHDLSTRRHHTRLLARLARVVEDVGMEVAVARVEHVADPEARGGDDLVYAAEHVRKLRARDDAVHHHVGWRDAAVRAEGGFATFPEQLRLGLAPRRADLARARLAACGDDLLGLGV